MTYTYIYVAKTNFIRINRKSRKRLGFSCFFLFTKLASVQSVYSDNRINLSRVNFWERYLNLLTTEVNQIAMSSKTVLVPSQTYSWVSWKKTGLYNIKFILSLS